MIIILIIIILILIYKIIKISDKEYANKEIINYLKNKKRCNPKY